MGGFLYLYMSLLTEEIDNWKPSHWVLGTADPLWTDIKHSLIQKSLNMRPGILPYGIIQPTDERKKKLTVHTMYVTPVFNDEGTPDTDLTTSFVYNKLREGYPDQEAFHF